MFSHVELSIFFYAFFDLQHICITSSRRGCQGTAKLLKKSFVGPVACWVPWSFANAQVPEAKCWISASWKCQIRGWKGTSVDGSSEDEYMAHGCTWHIGISLSSCDRERLQTLHTLPISSQKSNDVKICQIMSNVFSARFFFWSVWVCG